MAIVCGNNDWCKKKVKPRAAVEVCRGETQKARPPARRRIAHSRCRLALVGGPLLKFIFYLLLAFEFLHTPASMLRHTCRIASRQLRHKTVPRGAILLATNTFSTSSRMAKANLDSTTSRAPQVAPYDAFQLLPEEDKVGAEEALYKAGVEQVNEWFASPRYEGIKRPYTAEDVVSKRGALHQTYPSSLMARKLFDLFNEKAAQGLPVHTSKT